METKIIKILAIDDNPDNLISLNALIKEAFPDVMTFTALNGAKGLALAAAEDPDLILLDIVMPGMDGFEVCRKLKANNALSDIPVVFITALKGDKESRIHALECGAEAFLAKPIDESELTAQIRAMVKIKTANTEKRDEKFRLEALVAMRTSELEHELAEREMAEKALRESEERFRSVTQSANDAIITTNSNGLVLGWNRGAEKIFGYTEAEITGQKLTLIIPQKYEKLHQLGLQRVSTDGEHRVIGKTVELYGLHKNGDEFPIELSLAEWENASGMFFTGIIRDISERKKAEAAIIESEKRYRDIFNTVQDVFYQTDLEGKIIDISPSIYRFLEFDREEMLGQQVNETYFDKNDRDKLLGKISTHGELKDYEIRLTTKSGEIKYASVNARLMFDEEGNISHINGALRDITERKLAEAALQESETNYRELMLKLPDGVYKSTEAGKFIAVNPAMATMLGYESVEELMAIDIKTQLYFEEADREIVELLEGKTEIGVFRMKKKDGSELWAEDHGWLVLDENKNTIFHEGMLRDVTDRKKAEDALKVSEDKYRTMIEYSNDLIWTLDNEGNFVFMNETAAKTTGLNLDEWIGKSFVPLILEEDMHMIMDVFAQTIGGKPCNYELRFKKDDNSILSISVNTSPIYISGKVEGIVSFGRDISESKQAEKQLKLLGRAIDQSPVTVMITDKKGIIEYTNPKFTEITGYTPEEVKGKNPRILQSGEQTKEFYTELWDTILSGNVWQGEFHNKKKNGGSFWESAAISSITDSNGEVSFFLAVKEDITEKKSMIAELIKAKDRAEESDRLKSAFLSNMSHEIRTPMNGILGFAGLLKSPNLTGEQQQEYIAIIETSGARMLNIIKDIVDISKIEAGLMEVDLQLSNINQQTEYIYTFFKPEVEGKGMKLSHVNGLSGKAAMVNTDREKLYAILINLVKNAIKYSDTGAIEFGYNLVQTRHALSRTETETDIKIDTETETDIKIDTETETDTKIDTETETRDALSVLQFYVKDTGIGVPADRQKAIFDRFVQADISDTRAYQGAGLGLSISKAFVEMLGGTIWVESEEGKGSTFYFTIPYQVPVEEKPIHSAIVPVAETENEISGLKILIAEDDPTSEMLISLALKSYSKEIIKVKSGNAALEICRNNPDIDLIMMDIKMKDLDGYEATRQIRLFNKEVIIIAQTAYALINEREKALEAGCNDYISKPISVDLLRGLVEKYFKK